MITVNVRLFNLLAVYAGHRNRTFEVPDGTTIAQLIVRMANDYTEPFKNIVLQDEKINPHLRVFLNSRLLNEAELDNRLVDGDSLMIFPAIAGGSII